MSNIIDVHISLDQQYQIAIGEQLAQSFKAYCEARYNRNKIFVLIDENVNRLHNNKVAKLVSDFKDVHLIEIPEGESSKSAREWNNITNKILEIGIERSTPLLAIGGGVTGDLAGFVAATVLRGVPLIHMPTTLLAMVDSSIGGKTGINHTTGKNLIGSFYQPDAVFSDITFLETLEQKEWITGMAEILKYAAIRNSELFEVMEELIHQPLTPKQRWVEVVEESARIKVDIVQEDALEAGNRAYLNFGHTFGHALEKVSGYGEITHGEAVFVGMIAACHFSQELGHPVSDARFAPFLSLYKKQMSPLTTDTEELLEAMKSDKKVKDNTIRLVLLNEWGSPYLYSCEDHSMLQKSWSYTLDKFNT
ncbi:3-dehydroquinate synthase [Fodinibius sp.]|uniref:3-dehydroquinate synthase n=1 Tax=Fodinibius sp. TaxID=1872440 RepID=UPI002ACD500B|nr:3-dehydroquinate synthase [Fodinibius sp.]MDZ7659711.1 3-dehydroquinate synthase [Fodinibius sp.]